jgi:hypothetical protein
LTGGLAGQILAGGLAGQILTGGLAGQILMWSNIVQFRPAGRRAGQVRTVLARPPLGISGGEGTIKNLMEKASRAASLSPDGKARIQGRFSPSFDGECDLLSLLKGGS